MNPPNGAQDRIVFAGNPWPEGHPIAKFDWTARIQGEDLWFDLHLVSADYYAEREIEDREDADDEASDWTSPIVWGNYHYCTLSSTYWGGSPVGGIRVGPLAEFSLAALDGAEFAIDPFEGDGELPESDADPAFGLYLLGHDSAVDHRIRFVRRGDSDRYDLLWSGRIALSYAGDYVPRYRFQARIHDRPCPALPNRD
jgi:hypothetical protein